MIGLVFGGLSALFGSGSAEVGQVSVSLSGPAFLAYLALVLAYYVLMGRDSLGNETEMMLAFGVG